MQIVTDQGADLSEEQKAGLNIHYVPLQITLNEKTYRSGIDIDNATFYKMLNETEAFPDTSQPSPGDFAELYRELAKTDPEILSVHISSGLSGTINSAKLGAQLVPEAHVTIIDTKTLSCPEGWQVQAAAKAIRAGWPLEKISSLLARLLQSTEGFYTVSDLKYLIHGGRIGHIKGLVASLLSIKPVIGVGKEDGKYYVLGQEFTYKRAIQKIVDVITQKIPLGTPLRVQLLHGDNLEGVELLRNRLKQSYECWFDDVVPIAPILGAHTGPSMCGLAVAPLELFNIPELDLVPGAIPAMV